MTANREFTYVPIVFNQRVTELNYPMLAINIFDIVTKKPVYQSYTIKEIGGLRIGLIGTASNILDRNLYLRTSANDGCNRKTVNFYLCSAIIPHLFSSRS